MSLKYGATVLATSRTLVGVCCLLPGLWFGNAGAQMTGATPAANPQEPQHTHHGAGKTDTMEKPTAGGHAAAMAAMSAGNQVKLEPSTICKQCHASIHAEWSQSMHSRARESWYFSHMYSAQRMGMTCNNEAGTSIACPTCHEPGGTYPVADVLQKSPPAMAAMEGVTCEESADFCVACHGQLSNLNGLNVCDTVRAWRESKYGKEGKTCQSCHMPSFTGPAATGPGAPPDAPKDRQRHSHVFRGPNGDPSILATAATIVQEVKRDASGELRIQVKVTNTGTGHDMPSGLPDRLISLKVIAKDASGKLVWENWKDDVYREDRMAAFGQFGFNPMGGEVPPMGASRIDRLSLQPDESRTLDYKLDKATATRVRSIEARLVYEAARQDEVLYSGVFDLPAVKPKLMTAVETQVP
jgi:hypothetical protein